MTNSDHSDFHSTNAFCSNAGHEEYAHLYKLLDVLSDSELQKLVDAVGISFREPTKDIDRDTLEGVIDEADREVFYKEYHKIVDAR